MCTEKINFCIFSDLHCVHNSSIPKELANNIRLRMEQDNIEFVINLGDFIGAVEEKNGALEILKDVTEIFAELPLEKHFIAGNHDLDFMTKDEFSKAVSSKEKKHYYSFDHGTLHFIVLDMNYHPNGTSFANGDFEWFNAFLPDEELLWLKNNLKENMNRPTFIFTHQNLDDRKKGQKNDPEIIANAGEVRNILESAGNIIAVFQGHGHRSNKKCINGIEYISIESSLEKPALTVVNCAPDGHIEQLIQQ